MAHRLNWTPGREGKGNLYPNGDISTWVTDDEMNPHHHEVAMREMNDPEVNAQSPGFFFYINPYGGIHDGGIGFNNQTPKTDDQILSEIIENDPRYYNAMGDNHNFDYDYEITPREELSGGGYGHAQNLLNILSKIAKRDGWADFHTELKLPRSIRQRIRRWVDKLDWPENSEKTDSRTYHITILSMDEYDDDFAEWARTEMQGRYFTFKTTGMDIFADEYVVLRMECPEWTDLVRKWTSRAEEKGLEPHKFEPPKAHVTIGKSPDGKWPRGVPDPHIKFDARRFNINKNSMAGGLHEASPYYMPWEGEVGPEDATHMLGPGGPDLYHYAPTTERDRIRQHGLQVSLPGYGEHWLPAEVPEQPQGVYVTTQPEDVGLWGNKSMDLWRIPHEQIGELQEDPLLANSYIIPHDVNAELRVPYEDNIDFRQRNEERHYPLWTDLPPENYYEKPPPEYKAQPITAKWHASIPYLYHGRQEHPDQVRKYGIDGSWAEYYPTPSVYLTDQQELAEHFAQNPGVADEFAHPSEDPTEEYPEHPGRWVYKIDPSKLDATKLEADEWNTDYPEGIEYHGDQWSVTPELEQHVADPEVVQRQIEQGRPLAYRDSIPPEAIVDHWEVPEWRSRPWINGMRGASVKASEQNVADELRSWLQSRKPAPKPPSLHHTDADQFMPEVIAPASIGAHVDPPSKPYKPHNWAEEGWEDSPMNITAGADPDWWNQYIEKNPYAYHFTEKKHVPTIAERGLIPWDAPLQDAPGTSYRGNLEPRPGHIYLTPDPSRNTGPMGNPSTTHRIKVDLSKLDPERLAPDEDAGSANWKQWQEIPGYEHITDPDLPLYDMWNRGIETNPYKSGGEWAEGHGLNHPQMIQDSLTKGIAPSIAYRGAIPPGAIAAIDDISMNMTAASEDEELYVPGMARAPIKVIPHTWEETPYGEEPPGLSSHIRTPFLYDDHARTIHLGMPRMVHDDLYEPPSVPHGPDIKGGLLNEGELNHMGSPSRFNYGNKWKPGIDSDEVKRALEDHAGVEFEAPTWHEAHASHMNMVATWNDIATRTCAQCGAEINGPICSECGYDPTHADSGYEQSKANWYDRAWEDQWKKQPRPVPHQDLHWGPQDNATDVKFAQWTNVEENDQRDN